ncbi:MAG TPA: GDSL-type esterase/lipase family protein [Dehalococcoidia bacterium]|nr:GDSL-type esterase/lipase family protein [Dehalococcoidia bacterium]
MGDVRIDLSTPAGRRRGRNAGPTIALVALAAIAAAVLGVVYSPLRDDEKTGPSAVAGLRFWSSGDSTSYYMSVSLTEALTEMGAVPVQPEPEYRQGSGLLSRDFFDWQTHIANDVAATRPDIVFFMIGANDARPDIDLDTYRAEVATVMDSLRDVRYVVWIGQPHMADAGLAEAVLELNRIFEAEAAKRSWVRYVDTWAATSDAGGSYAPSLPDEDGIAQVVRADDGLHFTPEGGERLARVVLAELLD